jgi:integrase/recombinase XerD
MTTPDDSLAVWADNYLTSLHEQGATPRTIATRRMHIDRFVSWAAGRSITHGALLHVGSMQAFQAWLQQARTPRGEPYALLTLRGIISDVRAFGRWCAEHNLLTEGDPFAALVLPKVPASLPAGLFTPEQIAKLCDQPNAGTPLGVRNRAVLHLAAATGLTSSTLARLRVDDFESATNLLTLRPERRPKQAAQAARIIPTGDDAGRWLRAYIDQARPALLATRPPTAALFVTQHGQPVQPGDVAHIARKAAQGAGLPTRRVLSVLRDSLAVRLLDAGCDPRFLAALLGHADTQSVQKYRRLSVQHLQEVHRKFHPAEQS